MTNDKQPSFAERCRFMQDAAKQLQRIAEIVSDEADHMADAEKRFSERRRADRKERR